MKASPWLSDSFRRLNPRERRVVLAGATVMAAALVVVQVVLPIAHHWELRDARHAAAREQWIRLTALTASIGRLQRARDDQQSSFNADRQRLVGGATPALAASMLQGLIQRYALESSVQIEGVDAASDARPDRPGLLAIPVQLQARGDIAALVDFLYRVEHGDKLLVVDEMTINSRSDEERPATGTPPPPLSWTLRLHALYDTGGADSTGVAPGGGSVVAAPSRS
jgi:hypothetical protein